MSWRFVGIIIDSLKNDSKLDVAVLHRVMIKELDKEITLK